MLNSTMSSVFRQHSRRLIPAWREIPRSVHRSMCAMSLRVPSSGGVHAADAVCSARGGPRCPCSDCVSCHLCKHGGDATTDPTHSTCSPSVQYSPMLSRPPGAVLQSSHTLCRLTMTARAATEAAFRSVVCSRLWKSHGCVDMTSCLLP